MEEIKVSYGQIEKANNEITYMKFKRKNNKTGKDETKKYAEVHERVKAFRKVYPQGGLPTELIKCEDNICIFKCNVLDDNGYLLATGTASEKLTGNNKLDYINLTSMLENCETSAVGRALGFAGFGIDTSIATAEEVDRAEKQKDPMEDMPIQEGQKQWLKENCTEEELKNALGNCRKSKLSDLNFLEAERIRTFKEKRLDKKVKEEKEIF